MFEPGQHTPEGAEGWIADFCLNDSPREQSKPGRKRQAPTNTNKKITHDVVEALRQALEENPGMSKRAWAGRQGLNPHTVGHWTRNGQLTESVRKRLRAAGDKGVSDVPAPPGAPVPRWRRQ